LASFPCVLHAIARQSAIAGADPLSVSRGSLRGTGDWTTQPRSHEVNASAMRSAIAPSQRRTWICSSGIILCSHSMTLAIVGWRISSARDHPQRLVTGRGPSAGCCMSHATVDTQLSKSARRLGAGLASVVLLLKYDMIAQRLLWQRLHSEAIE
jgi:hypothetical protein